MSKHIIIYLIWLNLQVFIYNVALQYNFLIHNIIRLHC